MEKAHSSRYTIHPGSTKMYHDLREVYWWSSVKRCIVEYVARCPNCQEVKVKHQRPSGGVMRFGKKGSLVPGIDNVAYELELPSELVAVHSVFHISMLKKGIDAPSLIIPTEYIGVKYILSYEEVPVKILDR
ncbi:hypothetical protein MTR67_048552 [Solanum verrucosum]|uniref:Integrase zinc-binding domain-containing protein n=1 Tax=Solanum verrucosum TaxID=315347 RepID=A0AAF0UZ26_SOLVR|nr:hypothetical protein MTR67_048552 [Solanum verrucosum]